jgi:hypothetical protein
LGLSSKASCTKFAYVPEEHILNTIYHTTQYARIDTRFPLQKHFKSRFPATKVSRLNETVATDTFFFDIPALDDGIMRHGGTTLLQLYCGCESQLTAVFPMKTESEMAGTLEDSSIFMVPQMLCLVKMLKPKLVALSKKSCACTQLKISNANHIVSIRTRLNVGFKRLKKYLIKC